MADRRERTPPASFIERRYREDIPWLVAQLRQAWAEQQRLPRLAEVG